MKILFDTIHRMWGGLGNGGGTKTILKSAETLQELGHTVKILADVNNYNWHNPQIPIIKVREITDEINYDVIVSVAVCNVDHVLNFPIKNKVFWMRGYEKWQQGEEYLINQIKRFVKAGGRMITNSSWLQIQLLLKCHVTSSCCFAGLDLNYWRKTKERKPGCSIGGLWHAKHKTKNYHLFERLEKELSEDYKFHTLRNTLVSEQVRDLYNECDIWLSLSSLEGWHNPPAEAALCNNLIIYNDIDSGGTRDYCTPETAMPFKTYDELVQAIKNPDYSKVENMRKMLFGNIGDRESNMKKFVKLLGR